MIGGDVKDVAAHAGVSLGTVSNVLNRPDRVSPATRRRVEAAMADLGFVRNEAARHLRSGRSRTLAYVMLDAANPFFTDVAAGIEETAEEWHFSLYMCNSGNRADREAAHLDHLVEQRVQGILVTPIDPEAEHLAAVARRGHASGHRRPHHPRRVALLGRGRRRARRQPRPSSTCSTGAIDGSPSWAVPSRSARSATASYGARPGLGRRRERPTSP